MVNTSLLPSSEQPPSDSLGILHVPCNSPYIKKLEDKKNFHILNGNGALPLEITYQWILEHQNDDDFWKQIDILHIHYGFEFEKLELVKTTLDLVRQQMKPIVYTCHELSSVHGMAIDYSAYLQLILKYASETITLTEGAKEELAKINPSAQETTVIPHGFVTLPDSNPKDIKKDETIPPEILLFGALRSNRDTATTLINLLLGTQKSDCRIALATRPFTSRQLIDSPHLRTALEIMSSDARAQVELTLPLTDQEVADRIRQADIMVFPYSSGGHSGQLELAFDSGVLPVMSNVGFLTSQCQKWPKNQLGLPHAVVADWSDGKEWLYQPRLLQAVHQALKLLPDFKKSVDLKERQKIRTQEHQQILEAHGAVYRKALLDR